VTRADREERARDLRVALFDAIRSGCPTYDAIVLIEQLVRAEVAATIALCAEGMSCAFCKGWLHGHDEREAGR